MPVSGFAYQARSAAVIWVRYRRAKSDCDPCRAATTSRTSMISGHVAASDRAPTAVMTNCLFDISMTPQACRSVHPVLEPQPGHLLVILPVGGEQQGIVGDGNGRDLPVSRPDPDAAELVEQGRRSLVERDDLEPREEPEHAREFPVGGDLPR